MPRMAFFQVPPTLGNQFDDDRVLSQMLTRLVPAAERETLFEELRAMGELAGGELFELQQRDRLNEPVLTQWDPWGNRVDTIELTDLWKRCAVVAAERGLVATGYDRSLGARARLHQFSLVYLFDASSDVFTCPLAMTDGAAATLSAHGGPPFERAFPRLVSRDPRVMWTSGQWMTERTGGSDVGLTQTEARPLGDGRFTLHGTKWFTSATTSQMALTLARPTGNPEGGKGLALFFVQVRDDDGKLNGIAINRLKDKLGTRKVPTAELTLDGTIAEPVKGTTDGIRHITPMLNVTRTWNSIGALAGMRRGLALARDYARKRQQFGARLSDKPLHVDTLAGMQAEFEGAFVLVFRTIELLGKVERGEANADESNLLRLLTPLMKLTTAKQGVAVASEALECFGGAGYVEDTGLPRILRDAQVLSIWEGTTNVLSLDALRAIARDQALPPLLAEIERATGDAVPELADEARSARAAAAHAAEWLTTTMQRSPDEVEAGARRFAMTLGRATELALLVGHASWVQRELGDVRSVYAAKRLARNGVDTIREADEGARALAMDLS
jgi:acyl-CoA dehydrogenase